MYCPKNNKRSWRDRQHIIFIKWLIRTLLVGKGLVSGRWSSSPRNFGFLWSSKIFCFPTVGSVGNDGTNSRSYLQFEVVQEFSKKFWSPSQSSYSKEETFGRSFNKDLRRARSFRAQRDRSCSRASSLANSRYITQHAYPCTGPVAGPALWPTPGI